MKTFLLGFVFGVLAAFLVPLAAARFGGMSIDATAAPPAWERRIAGGTVARALEAGGAGLVNPTRPSEDALRAGMKLYRQDCAGCHGDGGRPSPWGSRNFYPRVPQFGVETPALSEPAMYVAVRRGIRYSGMGAWDAGMLVDADAWRIVTFLGHLRDLPPAVAAEWRGGR